MEPAVVEPPGRVSIRRRIGPATVAVALVVAVAMPAAQATDPIVRAVLFFSPTCPHCHVVIDEVLPPLFEEHGGPAVVVYDETVRPVDRAFYLITNGRLEILLADVTVPAGASLFHTATGVFRIESQGVPRLIVADRVMIGSDEIPEQFPGIVSDALDAGATIDWPAIPDLATAVAATGPATGTTTTEPGPPTTTVPTTSPIPADDGDGSLWDTFRRDPTGNSISVIVLLGMMTTVIAAGVRWRRGGGREPGWAIPALALLGLGVAAYLALVEVGGSEAVCGPVGDCNAVQQSDYARLFGLIPVGVAGVIGYLLVIAAWSITRFSGPPRRDLAIVALFAGGAVGTLFSMYLTFLEPFVIGATCMWCITSAIVITALMWLTVGPARAALGRLTS